MAGAEDFAAKYDVASVPPLDAVLAFKGVWALSLINDNGHAYKATHYATVLVYGRYPLWAVWTVQGRFVRFAASRKQIEDDYPHLTWMRKMARWQMFAIDDEDAKVSHRLGVLETMYGQKPVRGK